MSTTHRPPRATKETQEHRKDQIRALLGERAVPATVSEISFALDLTYSTVANLVRQLVEAGEIEGVGRKSRRITYQLAHPHGDGHREAALAALEHNGHQHEEVGSEVIEPMEPVSVNMVLRQLHLGRDLSVVGVEVRSEAKPVIELRSHDGEVVRAVLVS
jgi:hypothetical protein